MNDNIFIVTGSRIGNTKDNSTYNLNTRMCVKYEVEKFISACKQEDDSFPTAKEVFDTIDRKGVIRFNSKHFMFLIQSESSLKSSMNVKAESVKTGVNEADDRDPLSHALDPVGIKASTANSIEQDAVAMSIVEKEIDKDIDEAMKEIYR